MQTYLMLLRQRREFRYLWFAQVVSLLGDWFNTIATVILVNRYTDSGLAVGALFVARALPLFVLGPVAGVVADRLNRKMVLIATDLFRAVIVLALLFVNTPDRVWLVYVITVAQFSVSAFFEPARSAILPSLIKYDELLPANTLSSATWSAMLAFGAAIGGIAAGLLGTDIAIVIDAVTFLVSGMLVLQIVMPTADPDDDVQSTVGGGWLDMIDGFRYVKQQPNIGVLTLVKGLSQFGTADIMIALYAEHIFSVGEDGAIAIGAMYMSFGIGAIIGPILMNHLGDGSDIYLQKSIFIGFIMMPIGWFILGAAPILPVAMFGLILRSMGGSINWTYSTVLLQTKVENRFLGRVFALDFSIFTLFMASAVWLTGYFIDAFDIGPREMTYYTGLAYLVPIVLWLYFIYSRFAPALLPSINQPSAD